MNKNELFTYLKNNWNQPVQGVSSLGLAISSYWLPPSNSIGLVNQQTFLHFGRVFVIAIIWFLLRAGAKKWSEAEHVRNWLKVCITSSILSIMLFFGYYGLIYAWTYNSDMFGLTLIGGKSYTEKAINNTIFIEKEDKGREITREQAIELLNKENDENKEDLLFRFGGDINSIWSWCSLFLRRNFLGFVYLLGLPLFCIALISAIQTSYCVSPKPRKKIPIEANQSTVNESEKSNVIQESEQKEVSNKEVSN